MAQKLRYIPPSSVSACGMVEVTCRTLQARFLLRPSQRLRGLWHDQTSDWEARQRGKTVRYHDFRTEESVLLEPVPCWRHLPAEEIRDRVRHMVREIEQETAERHQRNGTHPLGRKAAQRVHPHDSPESPKRGPRPAFHATTREVREATKQAYREFAELFRAAAQDLRARDRGREVPSRQLPARPPVRASRSSANLRRLQESPSRRAIQLATSEVCSGVRIRQNAHRSTGSQP